MLDHFWCCVKLYTAEDESGGENYDAFISFAHGDEYFVHTERVPKLELESDTPFKSCLNSRDWGPGEWITEPISNSIDKSHRIIIVFS